LPNGQSGLFPNHSQEQQLSNMAEQFMESVTEHEHRTLETAYAYSVAHLMRLDRTSALQVLECFPHLDSWQIPFGERCCRHSESRLEQKARALAAVNWGTILEQAQVEIRRLERAYVRVIPVSSPEYPPLLRLCPDHPIVLFLKGPPGILAESLTVTFVGTRRSSDAEGDLASQVARRMAASKCLVVSSLAQGIDTIVQRGLLDCGMKGLVVFPSSLDKVYPAENKKLALQILEQGGAWITEVPPGRQNAFRKCHRVAVGLSIATVAIQPGLSRSVRRAARCAERYSRLLFCPQSWTHQGSSNPSRLLSRSTVSDPDQKLRPNGVAEMIELMVRHRQLLLEPESNGPDSVGG
jgi:predicted Rossmann fold nucleotide-binding protein DprA/Smf involved in DNA uptake